MIFEVREEKTQLEDKIREIINNEVKKELTMKNQNEIENNVTDKITATIPTSQPSEIDQLLLDIASIIDIMEVKIDHLEDSLRMVLVDNLSCGNNDEPPKLSSCPLMAILADKKMKLLRLNDCLASILERIRL
jgi:ribonuclease HII